MNELDELWGVPEDVEGERETFEDATGSEQTEVLQPIPPPMMVEKGLSAANTQKLSMHTGGQRWASKGNEMPAKPFDDDMQRPVSLFANVTKQRSRVQIDLNRRGTQATSERDDAVKRSDMYNGLNESIPRRAKLLIPTRRGTQPLNVIGAERNMGTQKSIEPQVTPTLKTGMHERDEKDSRGRLAKIFVPTLERIFNLSSRGGNVERQMPSSRAADVTPAAAKRPDHHLNRQQRVEVPVSDRVTDNASQRKTAMRSDVSLSSFNDVQGAGKGMVTGDTQHRMLHPDAVIGKWDSQTNPTPRPLTFEERAAIAAMVVLGTSDSTKAPSSTNVQLEWKERPLDANPVPTRRLGPIADQPTRATYESEYTRALHAARARDATSDSVFVERIVADNLEQQAALAVASARGMRNDGIHGRDPFTNPMYSTRSAISGDRVIGGDASLDITGMTREQRERHMLLSARPAAESRTNSDRTVDARRGNKQNMGPEVYTGSAKHARSLGDDGTLLQRPKPLHTGAQLTRAVPNIPSSNANGRETPTRFGGGAVYHGVNAPISNLQERRGNRE